jgi:1,2-diacylglycerol 3-alpha-glucosyltransferase
LADKKNNLSICLVAKKFPIQGRASDTGFLWPIAKGLSEVGHRVVVISTSSHIGKAIVIRDGVEVHFVKDGFPNLSHLSFQEACYTKFCELNKANPFQLVHCMDSSGILIAKNKKKLGVLVAFDIEATHMSLIFSMLGNVQESVRALIATGVNVGIKFLSKYFGHDRDLLAKADGIFVTSPQQRIFLERYYLYPEYHTYTVPYGVEISNLSLRESSVEIKKRFSIPENSSVVLTISEMPEATEVVNVLSAFEKVVIKKPRSYLIIAGDGPAFKKIEFESLNRALGSHVILTGALSSEEISDAISVSDIYVNMSSLTTGFEPAMIEAMSQKKVVIGSEVSPISNVIEDGIDGFLLRPADTLSLSNLIIEIFSGTLSGEDLGTKARNKVLNIFDTKRMISTIERSYREIIRKHSKKTRFRKRLDQAPENSI